MASDSGNVHRDGLGSVSFGVMVAIHDDAYDWVASEVWRNKLRVAARKVNTARKPSGRASAYALRVFLTPNAQCANCAMAPLGIGLPYEMAQAVDG